MTDKPAELVLVVGTSGSGNTLLARVLVLHGRLHTLEETHFVGAETTVSPSEDPPSPTDARRGLAGLIARRDSDPFSGSIGEKDHQRARFCSIRYERLISEPEPVPRDLFRILGLEFEPAMLQAPYTTSSTRSGGEMDGSARGFYNTAVSEWESSLPRGDTPIREVIVRERATKRGYDISSHGRYPGRTVWHMLRCPFHVLGMLVLNPRRLPVQLQSVHRL